MQRDETDGETSVQCVSSPVRLSVLMCLCYQVYAMVLPDHEINPRVPCKSGVLPR